MCLDHQLHTEKRGGQIYVLYAQHKLLYNEFRSPQKMWEKNMTKPVGSHIALSQTDTLCCQQKELEHDTYNYSSYTRGIRTCTTS